MMVVGYRFANGRRGGVIWIIEITGESMNENLMANVFMQFFLVFCGLQAWLHARESRRGAIAL